MDLLKQLYWINSPSHSEQGMSGFIRSILHDRGIKFETDEFYQIFSLKNPDEPILCAHIDQVGDEPITTLIETKDTITGDLNIGADDKNGIWIILKLLREDPNLNFIFSTAEEAGGYIKNILDDYDISDFPYCLVFDRKGNSDIIGTMNRYCSKEFEASISEIGIDYGYKPAQGIFSDCNALSYHINCVNLSCGYYNAHCDDEFTVKADLLNCLAFAKQIILEITEKWPLDVYEDIYDDFSDYDIIPNYDEDSIQICPHCEDKLIDFVENKICGYLCPTCGYEFIENYQYHL